MIRIQIINQESQGLELPQNLTSTSTSKDRYLNEIPPPYKIKWETRLKTEPSKSKDTNSWHLSEKTANTPHDHA